MKNIFFFTIILNAFLVSTSQALVSKNLESHEVITKCNMYTSQFADGKLQEPVALFSHQWEKYSLGATVAACVDIPKPFEKLSLCFNHGLRSFMYEPEPILYFSSFILNNEDDLYTSLRDVSFDIINAQPGTRLNLNDHLRINADTFLFYSCSFSFL